MAGWAGGRVGARVHVVVIDCGMGRVGAAQLCPIILQLLALALPASHPPHPPTALWLCCAADGSGKVDRAEFSALLDSLHTQAGKPSVSMRKSVHTSE